MDEAATRTSRLAAAEFVGSLEPMGPIPETEREVREAMKVHYSSESPEWYTPNEVVERAEAALGGIALDPCSNEGTPTVPAATHITKADDGLAVPWSGTVYMNPPYGRGISEWVEKLAEEYAEGRVTEAIALVPARTDTGWFSNLRDCAICFIRGRLRFSGMDTGAPFPSAVVYFGRDLRRFHAAFGDMGDTWVRWRP